jgi:hypothetical protein
MSSWWLIADGWSLMAGLQTWESWSDGKRPATPASSHIDSLLAKLLKTRGSKLTVSKHPTTIVQNACQLRLEAFREPIEISAMVQVMAHLNRPTERILKRSLSFS